MLKLHLLLCSTYPLARDGYFFRSPRSGYGLLGVFFFFIKRPCTSCFAYTEIRNYWALLRRQTTLLLILKHPFAQGWVKNVQIWIHYKVELLYFKVDFFFLRKWLFCHCFVVLVESENSWWTVQVMLSVPTPLGVMGL